MIYAFSPEGVACLVAVMKTRPLLAFDIDGTLAPIVNRPEAARVPREVQECLADLARSHEVAIVTGRSVADARRMFTFEPRYLVGNHGAEGIAAWRGRTAAFARIVRGWHDRLDACASLGETGVTTEDKRYSLSLHYRQAPDADAAYRAIRMCLDDLMPSPKIIDGKSVVNLLPPDAPNKGDALRALMAQTGSTSALYIGDDDTDEAVFRLRLPSVLTLRVEASTDSQAALFLRDQQEVLALLKYIAGQ